ncbi:mannitol dehydrogenase family protein [Rheinheimera riviphila]|uniref:Mannitol dehydrogenase family protein n=2 Tax=Rheinheimera riviphila TaxID=1834037 RepID=A0A437QFI5_9GAMM|nr:mannitol dehydrogenase family protein [Rheinheimera riviphila]
MSANAQTMPPLAEAKTSTLPRLSQQTLQGTAATIPALALPGYLTSGADQSAQPGIGIVHLGPGAFFRGHQAWYTHQALKQGGDWRICAVALRSSDVSDALTPQDGLYTLAVMEQQTSYQLIGSVAEVLVAPKHFPQVLARLTAAATKYVTMTITEKGYCLNGAGVLDLQHADIVHDLQSFARDLNSCADSSQPKSAIGLLVKALQLRFTANVPPFVVISCDNLTDNGHKLKNALLTFAEKSSPALANWLKQQLISPCTMVDSITPATDDALRQAVAHELGLEDAWPIKREAFCQWVIEDILPADRPAWGKAGVIYASDVSAFEKAKLRLLNAPHSTMAYLGVLLGIETVYDAMQQPVLVRFLKALVEEEIQPSFQAPAELDVASYSADIFRRFENPSVRHLLAQIAWDGSQKLPMRLIPVIQDNLAAGRPIAKLALAIAAWCRFIRLRASQQAQGVTLVDPLAAQLLAVAAQCAEQANEPATEVALFLTLDAVFPPKLALDSRFVAALKNAYTSLDQLQLSTLALQLQQDGVSV